jgi:hypothetical protein
MGLRHFASFTLYLMYHIREAPATTVRIRDWSRGQHDETWLQVESKRAGRFDPTKIECFTSPVQE